MLGGGGRAAVGVGGSGAVGTVGAVTGSGRLVITARNTRKMSG
jgi:hypothetical protein